MHFYHSQVIYVFLFFFSERSFRHGPFGLDCYRGASSCCGISSGYTATSSSSVNVDRRVQRHFPTPNWCQDEPRSSAGRPSSNCSGQRSRPRTSHQFPWRNWWGGSRKSQWPHPAPSPCQCSPRPRSSPRRGICYWCRNSIIKYLITK